MLFTEVVQQLRAMLGDYETVDDFGEKIPPQYPDDRLSVLLAISIKQVQTQLRVPLEYRLESSLEPPYLDPRYDINGQVSPTAERWWRVFLTGHVDSFSLSLQCTIL